jgi:hypothetical protein
MHHELHLRDQSQGMRACLFHEVIDRRDPAQDTEQEQHRNDVDIGQEISDQCQFRRNRNFVGVGKDNQRKREDHNDSSPGQTVQKSSELHHEHIPKQVTESCRLIDGPLLPELPPHEFHISASPDSHIIAAK